MKDIEAKELKLMNSPSAERFSVASSVDSGRFKLPQISGKASPVGEQVTNVFRNLQRVPSVFKVRHYVDANLPGSNKKSEYAGREPDLWKAIEGK